MALEHGLQQPPAEKAPGVVLGQAHLFQDDTFLRVENAGVEAGVDADVGEEVDRDADARDRQHHVVVGVIERGTSVHAPAHALHFAVDEPRRPGGRSLEEHVLEIMGEAELARGLVASTGAHPELQRGHVARAVLLDNDADAVREDLAHWRRQHGHRDGPGRDERARSGERDGKDQGRESRRDGGHGL
jgi:hypothetical protein